MLKDDIAARTDRVLQARKGSGILHGRPRQDHGDQVPPLVAEVVVFIGRLNRLDLQAGLFGAGAHDREALGRQVDPGDVPAEPGQVEGIPAHPRADVQSFSTG